MCSFVARSGENEAPALEGVERPGCVKAENDKSPWFRTDPLVLDPKCVCQRR